MATLTKPPMTLARMADSTELPPYIVFKQKTPSKGNVPGVIIRQQAKG